MELVGQEQAPIVVTGTNIKQGFWDSFQKLMHDPSLPFTTKVRVRSIYLELDKQTRALQEQYDEEVKKIKYEGEGPTRKCLEPEKTKKLDEDFIKFEIIVPGKRLKLAALESADLSASDLFKLDMLIEGEE